MSVHAMTYNELLTAYKRAESKEEQIALFMDTVTHIKKEIYAEAKEAVLHAKQETLREIKLEDLATKLDLKTLELTNKKELAEFELKIDGKINAAKWQVVGFVLATGIVTVAVPILLHHWGVA